MRRNGAHPMRRKGATGHKDATGQKDATKGQLNQTEIAADRAQHAGKQCRGLNRARVGAVGDGLHNLLGGGIPRITGLLP